jgi:ketosteroid isomerase-like protein
VKPTTANRKLCNDFFDAIERNDIDGVDKCYTPDMTMWVNLTGETMPREENLEVLRSGAGLHRRRTYDDRRINAFDDGFVVQYTTTVVGHDGAKVALSSCLVADVRDGKIARLYEYMDSGQFRRPRR